MSVENPFIIKSYRSHYGPGVESASNGNENREYFLGGKGGRCVRLTTEPPSSDVMKSESLNFLEPSGTIQTCNETDLPFEDHGSTVVKVLCYKSEGHWFDPSWCHWNFY